MNKDTGINTFDLYDASISQQQPNAPNPFGDIESETLLPNNATTAQQSTGNEPFLVGPSYDESQNDMEPIIIGPPQDSFNDEDSDYYDEPNQSRSSLIASNSGLKKPGVETAIPKIYDDDDDAKCPASASTEPTKKGGSNKEGKRKLTEEERRRRLEAYEENKKKTRVGKAEICFMTFLTLGIIAGVVTVILLRDQIWPPPAETPRPTRSPTPEPTLTPTTAYPSYQPSLSMVPTYTGYRDTVILKNIKRITPDLPNTGAELDDSTPQSKAAKFIIYDDPLYVKPYKDDQIMQRYALVTLYYATNGNNWTNTSQWLSKEPVCSWYGISCSISFDDDKNTPFYVTKVILKENNLSNEIPWEMKALTNLTDFSLLKNTLSGDIFSVVVSMDNLKTLDLRNNQFNEEIDPNLAYMSDLQMLYLEGNQFYGTIPNDLGKSQSLGKFIACC